LHRLSTNWTGLNYRHSRSIPVFGPTNGLQHLSLFLVAGTIRMILPITALHVFENKQPGIFRRKIFPHAGSLAQLKEFHVRHPHGNPHGG
jgi:hypothetical protein